MARINSRQKGARGERRAARFLTANGMPATRAARCGVEGGDDLICVGLKVALEVKDSMSVRPGTKAMRDALVQATRLADKNRLDLSGVLWWERRKGWRLTVFNWFLGKLTEVTLVHEDEIVAILKNNYEVPA